MYTWQPVSLMAPQILSSPPTLTEGWLHSDNVWCLRLVYKGLYNFPLFLDHSPRGKRSGSVSCSVVSDSLETHGLEPARPLCPWNSPGKNIWVGCQSPLQGIFLTQGLNPHRIFTIWATREVPIWGKPDTKSWGCSRSSLGNWDLQPTASMNLPGGKATSKEGPPGPDGLSDNAALVTAASQETVSQARPPQNQTHRHCEGYYMIIAVLSY